MISSREKETKDLSLQLINLDKEVKLTANELRLSLENFNLQVRIHITILKISEMRKNWSDEIDAFYKKKKREQSDNTNEMNKIKELIKQSTTLSGVVKDALGSMGFIVCSLLELSSMQTTVEIHELKDRKEISLYGSKVETSVLLCLNKFIGKCSKVAL